MICGSYGSIELWDDDTLDREFEAVYRQLSEVNIRMGMLIEEKERRKEEKNK